MHIRSKRKDKKNKIRNKGKSLNKREVGTQKELQAMRYLEKQGMKILQRNFRCHMGEIDLIARDGEETVFVEVKLRHDADFSRAADAVTPAKRERLKKTALFYFAQQGECPARFDVVEIYDKGSPARIHWIRNAFS